MRLRRARRRGPRADRTRRASIILALTAVLLLGLSGFAIYNTVTSLFDVYVVVTGSMEPAIPRGSIIIVRSIDTNSGETPMIGDVIAYRSPDVANVVFAHRLIGFTHNGSFILKGDAVKSSEIVDPNYVIGVVTVGIPGGVYLAIALPYIAFILLILTIIEGKE